MTTNAMEALREIDANAKLVGKSLLTQLLPLVSHLRSRLQAAQTGEEKLTWQDREALLSQFTMLQTHVSALHGSLQNDLLAVTTVLPRGLCNPSTAGLEAPQLLSTYISPGESDCVVAPLEAAAD
eukprot:gene34868-42222_t